MKPSAALVASNRIMRAHVVADDPRVRAALAEALAKCAVEVSSVGHDVEVWDAPRAVSPDRAARPVVALVDDPAKSAHLLAEGARAIVSRDASPEALHAAIAAAAHGLVVLDPRLAAAVTPRKSEHALADEPLTPREAEVLSHLAEGLGNRAIAAALGISEHTVKFHVDALRVKLGARTRTEVVVAAARRGLVIL